MNLLFLGDVVGQRACEFLQSKLYELKLIYDIDVTVVNGENSADGNGITPYSANLLLNAGADAVTTGNHCYKRREMNALYEESNVIIRPANLGENAPGKGVCILDFGGWSLAVINLIGTSYMSPADNPFKCADAILKTINTPNIFVDFHAESTGEKKAMGYYLAGRVSAVAGTHTHVQTADEGIIDKYTGYITDAGMTGVHDSVLGVEKKIIIDRMVNYNPNMHRFASGEIRVNGIVFGIDKKSGRCKTVKRINE